MLSRIVKYFLSKYFQEIFSGINHRNIHTELMNGKLVIQNISLQPEFISKLNLPIELKSSFVQKLSIQFAWRKQNSNLKISIQSIYAVLVDKNVSDYNILLNLRKSKQKLVKQTIKQFAERLKQLKEDAENKQQTSLQKYLVKLLDNIQLKIGYIHIRYQNTVDNFSFGLTINDILLETRDQNNKKIYFERDKTPQAFVRQVLQIGKFGIYWNSNQTKLLSKMNHSQMTEYMLLKPVSNRNIQQQPINNNGMILKYIFTLNILVTLKKLIVQDGINSQIQAKINIEQISCKVTQLEYSQVMKVVKYFLSHQSRVKQLLQYNQLQNFKPKNGKQVFNMMKQYHTEETKKYMQKNIRQYLTWVFKEIQESVIRKKFIELVVKMPKKVTFQNIFKNPRLVRIIQKTNNQKIKTWLFEALIERTQNQEKSPFLLNRNDDLLSTTRRAFSKVSNISKQGQINQNHVWLKFTAVVQKATFQIAQPQGLGLQFSFDGVMLQINLRNSNFYAQMQINDVSLVYFNDPSKQRAQTSILRKNTIDHGSQTILMKVRFEKNPLNKPYVFAQMDFQFRSIQVNIFPSTIKHLYALFTNGIQKSKQQKMKKTISRVTKQQNDYQKIKSSGFQKNIINARIHSPWIIMPLSRINDSSSDCWVVRLGDLQINTPNEPNSKQQLYYEGYNIMLQNFQLKYFSSVRFYYNWLKFKDSPKFKKLFDSGLIENGRIIQVVKPFSCSIHAKSLKKFLSTNIRDSTLNYKIEVQIQEIQLSFSTFIMSKLKKLYDDFQKGQSQIPIQLDKDVLFKISKYQHNVIVNYKEFQNFRFYIVYFGGYLYLFLTQNSLVHNFLVPISEIKIVLKSFQSQKYVVINHTQETQFQMFFDLHGQMLKWKTLFQKQFNTLSQPRLPNLNSLTETTEQKNPSGIGPSVSQIKQSSKYSLMCKMPKLSFKFYDEANVKFVNGMLAQMQFHLEQKYSREVRVSLNKFIIDQPTSKQFPMLFSSQQYGENDLGSILNRDKFMQIQIKFDQFTNVLRQINMKFKRLTVAWKVELIQKILSFCNIDIVSPPTLNRNVKKRQILIKLSMESWDLIMMNQQIIFAQAKLSDAIIGYDSANQRQIYSFNGKIQFFGCTKNGDNFNLSPVFTIRKQTNIIPKFQVNYTSGSVQNLQQTSHGHSTISAISFYPTLKITMQGYQLVYSHEAFNRLFNYTLNKLIGSVTSKFRIKKQYAADYIFETLKIKKPSIFDIVMNHCIILFPGDIDQKDQRLVMNTKRITINRNLDSNFSLQPKQFPSKMGPITVNYQKMIVTCHDAELYYVNDKKKQKIPVIEGIIGFQIQYNKYNLSKEYFPVLRDVKQFDLTANVIVTFQFPVEMQLQKSVFLQILRTYYRNIKQKDGKALQYQPASLYPTPRVYTLNIPPFRISFMEQNDSKFTKYFMVTLPYIKINARQLRSDINATIISECLHAQYYDNGWVPIVQPIDNSNCPFKMQMKSVSGDMTAQIKLYGLNILGDLNQLNNIVDFIDFDPSDAQNFRMPKKPKKSFQNFKIFLKDSFLAFQSSGKLLQVKGVFFIDYLKNPEGVLDDEIKSIFGQNVTHFQINQKQIKVNAQSVQAFYDSKKMSQLPNVMYRRHQITNRVIGKKLRRQYIFLQQFLLCLNTNSIPQLQQLYKKRLKKDAKTKKSFFDLNSIWTPKRKYDEKRKYNVSSQTISLILLGQPPHKSIQPIIKITVQISQLVAILINSSLTSLSTIINMSVWNKGYKLDFLELVNAYNLCVNYRTPQSGKKQISFSGNTIKINGYNIHEQVINKLLSLKDSLNISTTSKQVQLNFNNDTDMKVKINLRQKNQQSIVDCSLNVFERQTIQISQLDLCKLYMGNIQLTLMINQQTFVLDLLQLQLNKLFNIGNLLYLIMTYDEKQGIMIQFETKFRLENLTNLQFQYSLMASGNSKSKGFLQGKKNVNFNFEQGDRLYIREQISKQEISLDLKKTFKKLNNFNISLELQNKAVYVCKIYPKVIVHNQMPMTIIFAMSKLNFELPSFEQKQLPFEKFFQKKEVIITINNENYRCQTNFFKQSKAVLQLISPNKQIQKIDINFNTKQVNNSIIWSFQSPIVLLNASYHNLTLKQNLKVNHLSTVTLNKQQSLRLGEIDIVPAKLKLYEQIQASSLLTLEMMTLPNSKTPLIIFNSQILFINKSSCDIILNNKFKINSNQALPLSDNPQTIPLSINTVTDKTFRNFDFSKKMEFFFLLNNQKTKHKLKLSLNKFQVRKILVLQNNADHYSLKNSLVGFTLVIKQQGQLYKQQFIVRESSEGVFTMQDPLGHEIFEIQFYLNAKSKQFKQKLICSLNNMQSYEQFVINEQGEHYVFDVILKNSSKGIILTISQHDELKSKQKQELQIYGKNLTIALIFDMKSKSQMITNIQNVFFKMQKHKMLQKYGASIQNLEIRYKDTMIFKKNKQGNLIQFQTSMTKWNKYNEIHDITAQINSINLVLKQDIVLQICSILKNINLISDKKLTFKKQKSQLVYELIKGNIGLNQFNKLFMKFYKSSNTIKINKDVLIHKMKIYPISANLSYIKQNNELFDEFKDHPLLKYLMILPDIRELKIHLPQFILQKYQGDSKGFKKKITSHIKKSIPNHIVSSINSISIIQSPVDALDMLGNLIDALWFRKQ